MFSLPEGRIFYYYYFKKKKKNNNNNKDIKKIIFPKSLQCARSEKLNGHILLDDNRSSIVLVQQHTHYNNQPINFYRLSYIITISRHFLQ